MTVYKQDTSQYKRIGQNAIKCWQVNGALQSIAIAVALIAIYILWYKHWYILLVIPLAIALNCFVLPRIEYKQWRYFIDSERVETLHGIFVTRRDVIPVKRIQHLKVTQGITQKWFDLSDVTIYTAAGTHKIEALTTAEAHQIIESLNTAVIVNVGEQNEEA